MWLSLILGAIAVAYFFHVGAALYHLRWAQRLPAAQTIEDDPSEQPGGDHLVCSVVMAARNEAARLEATVRHVLAQRGVSLEVIVVDDRSTDGTRDLLHRLAEEDSRLRFHTVEVLPDGWLGKCHACHIGAEKARGVWILFTDADCWLQPDVLARALHVAQREKVEHVTMTPGVAPGTWFAQAWHLAFLISLANWLSGVNRDRPKSFLGMGAFNLVRADAYRQCGGYEALRMTVVDDIKLGLLLRRAGFRTRAFIGGDDVECHWGTTARNMIKIMEKNYFAAIDYRLAPVLVIGVIGPISWSAAALGPLTGTVAGIAAGLSLVGIMAPAAVLARRLGWSLMAAVFTPLIYPALFYAVLHSAWVTLRQGGVRWRDTFYSLQELRAGNVQ